MASPGGERRSATSPRLGPLDRLRLRLTAWYVGTFAAILLVLGGGLFLDVARQIGRELDGRLDAAVEQVAGQTGTTDLRGISPLPMAREGISLYLLDSAAHPIAPDTAGAVIRSTAAQALVTGHASVQAPIEHEQELRIRARAFSSRDGRRFVAVASADLEDLEDRYARLISQFVVAAAVAVALIGLGGVFLARKSAIPVERAVEGMRRFMSDAGHEMRTPVTVLRTEAEVALQRARDPEEDAQSFARIVRESARLSVVVDDLFMLARAETGELPIEMEALYLDDVVSNALAATTVRATSAGVALRCDQYEEAPIRGNATLLMRLVMIVLDNAVKFTPPGGTVSSSVRRALETVVLEVIDTGIGIDPQSLPHVFDRFYRAESSRATSSGAGLGLAIARWIAMAHDGDLTIESPEKRGTTVRLTLPRVHSQAVD